MNGVDLRHILSKNIKFLRGQRSLSQSELAEKAEISVPFLSNIERGNKWPHPDTLVKIAKALEVEVYVLFQANTQILPSNTQTILARFKKDITTSLHKTITSAIDYSIETIGSHYVDRKSKKRK